MPDDAHTREPTRPSGRARAARMAVVFVLVVVVAALLGRLGTGVDDGPAVDVEAPVPASAPG